MPARDGTGPYGTGPVGRGLGPCGGKAQETDQQFGMGMAHRRGRRFGNRHPRWGCRENAANNAVHNSEILSLQSRQSWLQEQLAMISRRIEALSKPSDTQ